MNTTESTFAPDPQEVREAVEAQADGWNHSPPYTTPLARRVREGVDEYVRTGDPALLASTAFEFTRNRLMKERA